MSTSREPGLWEVDANLRPEGKSGPLVRTLASHESYYARWAESWEFQALLKARTIAGDTGLGARYEAAVAPLIWSSAGREGFVESVRVHAPPGDRAHPRRRGAAADQAGPRRTARRRIHRPAAAAGARQVGRIAALPGHHLGHRRAVRRRLHRPLRRRRIRPGLPVPAAARTPHPAVPAAPHPPDAGQGGRRCAPWPRRCWGPSPRSGPSRTPWWPPGAGPSAPSANCTTASSTGRCSTRPPRSAAKRPG